jgi:TolB protein
VAVLLLAAACGGDDDGGAALADPQGRIVFSSNRDGNEEIYLMGADGSAVTRLTEDPAADNEPSADPGGTIVAFASTRGGQSDIWAMDIDGGNPRQLTNDPAADSTPQVSPGGSRIAHFTSRLDGGGSLWVIEVATGATGPLLATVGEEPDTDCAGGHPRDWVNEGTVLYVGFKRDGSEQQICTVDQETFDVQLLFARPEASITTASLSPDGEKVVYASTESQNVDIWIADPDGSNAERLTVDPGIDSEPEWSPDGAWIVFHSERDGDSEIYIMRPDGSDVRQLTDNDADEFSPEWIN